MQAKFAYILAWHLLTYRKTRYNKQLESAMQACKHRAEALRDRLPEGYFLSENDRTMYRVLLQRGLSGQELDISALGENLSPQAVDRLAKWQLPGAPPVTDEEAEDCLKCLRDYAARMSRDELGQLSGEALRQYIENLNREKNRRKE